ncbi:MAG: hypothetical protein JWO80_5170 [Bryobacterales bacterium]|nr:hypothetical protein [Bryobacterales bacterium]
MTERVGQSQNDVFVQLSPTSCRERHERFDEIQTCFRFLRAATEALGETIGIRDPAALMSLRQEARAIREHLTFLKEAYLRHLEQHGC